MHRGLGWYLDERGLGLLALQLPKHKCDLVSEQRALVTEAHRQNLSTNVTITPTIPPIILNDHEYTIVVMAMITGMMVVWLQSSTSTARGSVESLKANIAR